MTRRDEVPGGKRGLPEHQEPESRPLQNGTNDGVEDARKRPLHYWDDLRENVLSYETRENSAIYKVNDGNETVRFLAHIASLQPYSEIIGGIRVPADSLIYAEASTFLAMHHFNERSPAVLPDLSDLLDGCNLYMTFELLDTILSPIVASRKALDAMIRPKVSIQNPLPTAIAGAARSAVSHPLSILAGVNGIPMVNGQSTSSALDIKSTSPTFVRTVPTNRLDAQATVVYLKSLGVTHFGVLFVRDAYGSEFHRDMLGAAASEGLIVASAPYNDKNEASIAGALKKLKDSQFRYVFAILTPATGTLKFIIQTALNLNMIGSHEYVWLFSEGSTAIQEKAFYRATLDSSVESDRQIAEAMSGTGLVLLDVPQNERFDEEVSLLGLDKVMYDYYVSKHDAPEVFTGLRWRPDPFFYQYLCYDVIIALGVGLCNMTEEFPSGHSIVDAVKATEFLGSSGSVSFDSYTGTRTADSVKFKVVNLLVDPSEDKIDYNVAKSALIHFNPDYVEVLAPFVYAENTTEVPSSLPLLDGVNYNLLGLGVRVFGWTLAGIVILLSAGLMIWTLRSRRRDIVRVAQPLFLCFVCFGAILMAASIVPMSLQEPVSQRGLDISCMAVPWLFIIGFAAAFASLFCKLLRINKVFRHSAGMRRVKVKAKDVMAPFVLFVSTNFAILLTWTLVEPLSWSRVPVANYDQFGQSVESYGMCFAASGSDASSQNAFLITLGSFNLLAVIFANYQSYLSRNLPADFNESYYLSLSMASILEGFLIGVPILFVAADDPTVSFVVSSLVISFVCFAILLPTFVPKIVVRYNKKLNRGAWRDAWRTHDGKQSSPDHADNVVLSGLSVAEIRGRVVDRSKLKSSQSSGTQLCHHTSLNSTSSVAEIRERVAQRNMMESVPEIPEEGSGKTKLESR